ncbi:MAG TPA: peptidylprolyl isomerase [Candidatus Saccharimonadia bacterium]|nr:peptidylprolyl isomerase [Candidatus Saccharimonadia bacterium]
MKKPKKPKLPKKLKSLRGAGQLAAKGLEKTPLKKETKTTEEKFSDALSNVPRITNETVGEHREEVLSSARKYIYPLQHSKNRVVKISLGLFVAVIVAFFSFVCFELYHVQATGGFFYDVTKIIPFPVGKTGGNWVSYESYLFELRRNMHYYQTQQQATFKGKDGRAQLARLKEQAMAQVLQDAYVKQLARQNHVSVSDQQVNDQITVLRNENRLGSSQQSLASTLNSYFGWRVSDLKRKVKQELLAQAVVAKLDTTTDARAQNALDQLQKGADFGQLAGQVSDDPVTKGNGGQYAAPIMINDADIPPSITAEVFKLKPGQVSGIINTGFTLEIIKTIDNNGTTAHAAHIQFTFVPITNFVTPLQKAHPTHEYIKV